MIFHNEQGFTFIELMMSLFISSVLMYALSTLQKNDLNAMALNRNLNGLQNSLINLSSYYQGGRNLSQGVYWQWQSQVKQNLSLKNVRIEKKGGKIVILWHSSTPYWQCSLPYQTDQACFEFFLF